MRNFNCCRRENIKKHLYGGRGRFTFPRKLVLEFFHTNRGHFTADEVYSRISRKHKNIGLATVYRTLNLLHELGILNKILFGDNKAKYELSSYHEGRKHHHHLICERCGKIIEYDDFVEEEKKLMDKVSSLLAEKYGFNIKGHDLYFYGLCDSCKKGDIYAEK